MLQSIFPYSPLSILKITVLVVITLLWAVPSSAQAPQIHGKLLAKKDSTLVNISIYAYQKGILKGIDTTDREGFFSIVLNDTGKYELIIAHPGFRDTMIVPAYTYDKNDDNATFISFEFTAGVQNYRMILTPGWGQIIHCPIPSTFETDEPGRKTFTREELYNYPDKR